MDSSFNFSNVIIKEEIIDIDIPEYDYDENYETELEIDVSNINWGNVQVEEDPLQINNENVPNDQLLKESMNRTCFVNLHWGVNVKEISSCRECKKIKSQNQPIQCEESPSNRTEPDKHKETTENLQQENHSLSDAKTRKYNLKSLHSNNYLHEKKCHCCQDWKSSREQNKKLKSPQDYQVLESRSFTNQKLTNSSNGQHECQICHKILSTKSVLKKHSYLHLEKKPFVCNLCHKGFAEKSKLKRHLLSHSNKQYKCGDCDRYFDSNEELQLHIVIHRQERPYGCKICYKFFSQQSQLKKHLKIHEEEKPYECKICFQVFTDKNQMKLHMFIHRKEKAFECSECHQRFSMHSGLRRHMIVHKVEKSVTCKGCYKTFNCQGDWKDHLLDCVVNCIQRKDRTNVMSVLRVTF